jgi:hypothetical protein
MLKPYRHPFVWVVWLVLLGAALVMARWLETPPDVNDYPPLAELFKQGLALDSSFAYLNKWEGYNLWILIAKGYESQPEMAVKFPLYPVLARSMADLLRVPIPLGMFIVHKLALLIAIAEVYRFWQREQGAGMRAVMWLVLPFAWSLLVYIYHYDEVVYLALFWVLLNLWRNGQYAAMMFAAALLTLARPPGLFLAGCLAIYALWDYERQRPNVRVFHGLWWLPVGVGLLWIAYISNLTGQFFAPFTAQAAWGRTEWRFPLLRLWDVVAFWLTTPHEADWVALRTTYELMLVVAIALPLLMWAAWRKKQAWLTVSVVYTLMAVLIPLATATNVARLSLVTLVPFVFLLLPEAAQPTLRRIEPLIWIISAAVGLFLTLMAGTTYNQTWHILYSP